MSKLRTPEQKAKHAAYARVHRKSWPSHNKEKRSEARKLQLAHIRALEAVDPFNPEAVAFREEVRLRSKKWYQDNKEHHSRAGCRWQKNNRDRVNSNQRAWCKSKRISDPAYKITRNLRTRLGHAVRAARSGKVTNALDLLGCGIDYFMKYISGQFKENMTWDNYGTWHIDHRKPVDSFDMNNEEDQRWCFHYSNLQPLWAAENLSKSNKFPHEGSAKSREASLNFAPI